MIRWHPIVDGNSFEARFCSGLARHCSNEGTAHEDKRASVYVQNCFALKSSTVLRESSRNRNVGIDIRLHVSLLRNASEVTFKDSRATESGELSPTFDVGW